MTQTAQKQTQEQARTEGEALCPMKKTSIGGQALIEGVMMRGPERTAMAVRHISGEIVEESWPTTGQNRAAIWKVPFFRGIYGLVDSMRFGYKCLMRSAEMAGLEEESSSPQASSQAAEKELPQETAETGTMPETAPAAAQPEPCEPAGEEQTEIQPTVEAAVQATEPASPVAPKPPAKNKGEDYLMSFLMVVSTVLGVCLAVFLFMWLPAQLANWLRPVLPIMGNRVVRSIFEGLCRIVLFVGYVSLVSLMKDIRRVFMYHGAEHKTIFCYEKGLPLTVENVRMQSRFHPRCGTSFMVLMLLVGILVAIFIPGQNAILRTFFKLLTLPVVVGVGYELIKLAGRKDNLLTRIISAPGLWVQRITTKEPDDDMIECAIAALQAVIPADPEADRW